MATARTRTVAGVSLTVVLAASLLTLGAGALVKEPCASGLWSDGRQYRQLCYSDIVPLYGTEHLTGGRLPYLTACPASAGQQCDEYPVLTMYLMRAAAWVANAPGGCSPSPTTGCFSRYFWVTAFFLGVFALVAAWLLWVVVGSPALFFAVAPTLLIYAFVNWDLLAVALSVAGTVAFLRNRDEAAGALIGLGAAAKFFPGLLLIPFALERIRQRRRGGAAVLIAWGAVAYAVVDLPFVLGAPKEWWRFFAFNGHRPADWDSLWYVACNRLHTGCFSGPLLNVLSWAAFAASAVLVWRLRRARWPGFPRWTFGFPLLVLFLLTSKVYSPQYGLWLLPWFALALPDVRWFVAFEVADVAVFVTRFSFFGRLSGVGGLPIGWFQASLLLRAVILIGCLAAWVVRSDDAPDAAAGPGADDAVPQLTG